MKSILSRCSFTCFLIVLVLTILTNRGYSATFYVDQNHPSASDSNLGTENLPWKHAWYGAQQLNAGDTLYIKAGYYYGYTGNRYTPGVNPINSGTAENPIVIKAYPGHDVSIMGTDSINNSPSQMTNPAIGAYKISRISHIIIDGFKIYGTATFWKADYCELRNSEIWGGGDTEFGTNIRIENSTNIRIYNNLVRDNVFTGASTENSVLLMEYTSSNIVIENNEFRNGVSYGVYLKDRPIDVTVRYNLIKNCGFGGISMGNQDMGNNVYIYQNIIKDSQMGIYARSYVTNLHIYNNVIYNSSTGDGFKMKNPQEIYFYDNIIYTDNAFLSFNSSSSISNFKLLDYNTYYNTGKWWADWGIVATSLSEWQNYSDVDGNSTQSNPKFKDPSDNDFRLQNDSPCKGAGKDGKDIGAYPNGDDGTFIGSWLGAPGSPRNLRIK